ncbi:MAG: hypothetical protein HS111_36325 [Kofleriaceae bacterium]|nr:hypothetical protein [Kofleriaceae bacterium]
MRGDVRWRWRRPVPPVTPGWVRGGRIRRRWRRDGRLLAGAAVERRSHRIHGRRPVVGPLRQHGHDQGLERGIDRGQRGRGRRRLELVQGDQLAGLVGDERRAAAQHLEDDAAQRVDVAAVIDARARAALLR